MDRANDPLSSAKVEDPVDSLEEAIRSLPRILLGSVWKTASMR